jgi:hypothetical protein
MPNLSDILSVVIGVTFIFLILSLLNTWVQELIASILSLRSKNLADILQNMLDPDAQKLEGAKKLDELKDSWGKGPLADVAGKLNENALKAVYDHQLIKSLSKPGKLPSYIHARDFTTALLDLLNNAGSKNPTKLEITIQNIQGGIDNLKNDSLRMRLQSLMNRTIILENKAEVGIGDFRKSVESWFDSAMDRGSGWYKRRIQYVGIITGIIIAIIVNADTIGMASALWQNSVLREAVTETAVFYTQQGDQLKAQAAQQQLVALGFPFGWSLRFADQNPETPADPRDFPSTPVGWATKVVGILITGFATSQGSPIWFDLLNRLINLRGTGAKPAAPAAAKAGEDEEDN